jgi:hypothetical protein
MTTTHEDPELAAMAQVLKSLEALPNTEAQHRVIDWVSIRLGLSTSRREPQHTEHVVRDGQVVEAHTPAVREGTVSTVANKLGANS